MIMTRNFREFSGIVMLALAYTNETSPHLAFCLILRY